MGKRTNRLKADDETLDTFYKGRILVLQKKKGYRFSVDAPLLADFIQTKSSDVLLELGTGNGIISLLLSIKPFRHITALEIQGPLADLARRNVVLNNLEERVTVREEDFRTFHSDQKFEIIFANPPYIQKRGGHLSISLEKSIAKHELKCDIFDIMRKTEESLKEEGKAFFIYPARRKDDLFRAAESHHLKIRALRFICPRERTEANLFLSECGFSSGSVRTYPPLILYDENGEPTEEARQIFTGRTHGPAF
ncbi:MAG: methyltransferase [Candidatus Aminicenantales bacterium]